VAAGDRQANSKPGTFVTDSVAASTSDGAAVAASTAPALPRPPRRASPPGRSSAASLPAIGEDQPAAEPTSELTSAERATVSGACRGYLEKQVRVRPLGQFKARAYLFSALPPLAFFQRPQK
jgi:hypothetical protein